MQCLACASLLTPYEESKKYAGTSILLELCDSCHDVIRDDLIPTDDDFRLSDEHEEREFHDSNGDM